MKLESYGDLTLLNLAMHYKNFYELSLVRMMMCYGSLSHMYPFFRIEDICIGLQKLPSWKACDLQCVKAEMLKWKLKEAHAWISDIFNHALQHHMSHGCTNWIKSLHKRGDNWKRAYEQVSFRKHNTINQFCPSSCVEGGNLFEM